VNKLLWLSVVLLALMSFYFLDHDGTVRGALLERSRNIDTSSLVLLSLIYSILLAVPFVAGVEIGICLMGLFGFKGILAAYLGTVLGLSLAYFFGRKLGRFYTLKQKDLPIVKRIRAFSFYVPRWLSLALLINTPGNAIFGGGGGIAMAFGMERNFTNVVFFSVILFATLPVPLLVYFGFIQFRY